jgi:2-polyprenyl-3-methyl-5-hydroxy-6-metoxy-1,4-benzoquinol methylase
LSRELFDSTLPSSPCDLCGAHERRFILTTPRLDGPLVQCRNCSLYYVPLLNGHAGNVSSGQTDGQIKTTGAEMERLAARARELRLVEPGVEEGERPWRVQAARERIRDLCRFIGAGRLLEVGSSTGELLEAAAECFTATGIEADRGSSQVARERGLDCRTGTLGEIGFAAASFDVAVLYHTIEHLPSPRRTLGELHRLLPPGGWLAIETPNIANIWYRLLGARWRQFIPDHLYFFTPQTITRSCRDAGFEIRELRSAGKAMSWRLFISRIGRYSPPLAATLSSVSRRLGLDERTLRLNLGDVLRLYAQRSE